MPTGPVGVPTSPPPPGVPEDYANLSAINGDNIITTDESSVTVSGISDGVGATIVTYLVPYFDDAGQAQPGSTIIAESSAVTVTDLGTQDTNGNELGTYSATLPTSGLSPGIYVAESYLEIPNGGNIVYEDSGADSRQIVSVETAQTQTTPLELAGTNAEISTDGRYLVYTAINEYNEPEITGDVYERDLQTGAETDLTATGAAPTGVFAVNHPPSLVVESSGSYLAYPSFTSANGEYTFGTIHDFDLNPTNDDYNPLPVVTNNSTGYQSVLAGIGVPKFQVGAATAVSNNGNVVLSTEPFEVQYYATGSSYIEMSDPQLYITYLNPAPVLTIDAVNGNNMFANNAGPVTLTGSSSAIGQAVEIDFGAAGAMVGTATVNSIGQWSFTFNPTTLAPAASLYIEASVTGTDGTPANTSETAVVTGADTFSDNQAATSGPQSGQYLWSNSGNWTADTAPFDGETIALNLAASGIDDIGTLTVTTLTANGEVATVEGTLLTVNTLTVDQNSGIDALSNAAGGASTVSVIVGTLTGSGALLEASGTNASLLITAATEPGEFYQATDGGRIVLDALSSASTFGFGDGGTLALVTPGATTSGVLEGVNPGDVLELPGTLVLGASFGTDTLTVTTSSGIYDFTDVNYGGNVGRYTSALDPATGLEAITFAATPVDSFIDGDKADGGAAPVPYTDSYFWSDPGNWQSGIVPQNGDTVNVGFYDQNGDDILSNLSLSSLILDAAVDAQGSQLTIGSLDIGPDGGFLTAQGFNGDPQNPYSGGITVTVDSISSGLVGLGADGAEAVMILNAPVNNGSIDRPILFADGGGLLELTTVPGSAEISFDTHLLDYYNGPATIAFFEPGATISALLESVKPEDVLELPGTAVSKVNIGTASLTITTNAGTTTFTDVGYGATVTNYTAAFDPVTGLEGITLTGPSNGVDDFNAVEYRADYPTLIGALWSDENNWSDGVPRNGASVVLQDTSSQLPEEYSGSFADISVSLASLQMLTGTFLQVNSTLETGSLTIASGAELYVLNHLSVTGTTINDGTMSTDPSTLVFGGAVTGTGTIDISAGSNVVFNGSVASSEIIDFLSTTGTLTLNDPEQFGGTVVGTGVENIACFAAGTRIRNADGAEIPVETLRAGDKIKTGNGDAAEIIWIGHRKIQLGRHPNPQSVQPVLLTAGALGGGMPRRDLAVSPDHALYLNGHLIPAKSLINGFSIRQLNRRTVTYYHIELAEHAVLFAEGTPAETYLETGNRGGFENGGAAITLHPDFAQTMREQQSCAPFAEAGPVVEAVRQRILDHAQIETTDDPALNIRYENGAAIIESRSGVPGDHTADPRDRRRLGVKISALEIAGAKIPLDHPALSEGWHDIEPDGRWTNGRAIIPKDVLGTSDSITISLAATLAYPCRDQTIRQSTGSA